MNAATVQVLVNLALSLVATGGLYKFLTLKQDRRKLAGDATSAEASAASTLTGGALELVEATRRRAIEAEQRADRAERGLTQAKADQAMSARRIDHLEDQVLALRQRERDLESAMVEAGLPIPPRRRMYDSPPVRPERDDRG